MNCNQAIDFLKKDSRHLVIDDHGLKWKLNRENVIVTEKGVEMKLPGMCLMVQGNNSQTWYQTCDTTLSKAREFQPIPFYIQEGALSNA